MMPGLLVLLPLIFSQDAAADVANDPALQKKITVQVKSELINDALKEIGKEAGVPLAAVQNVWDLKVNVFAKGEAVGPLMDRIADVLGLQWTKDGDVYRLGFERLVQQQRQAYEQAEQRAMRERLDTELLAFTRFAAVNPNAPKADLSKLSPEERVKMERLAQDPLAATFGQMLTAMSGAVGAGFWRGEVRTYAPLVPTAGGPGAPVLDESRRIFARFDPNLVSIERAPGRSDGLAKRTLLTFEQPPEKLSELPFAKSVLSWSATGDKFEDDDRLARSVPGVPLPGRDFFAPKPTLDEGVEAFFKGTGVTVVSDSFSVPSLGVVQPTDGQSWIKGIRRLGAQANVKHSIVGVRHNGFWRLRQYEIASGALRSYVQLADREPLTLDQYASFAGTLKSPHASALMLEDAVSLPFDSSPLPRMLPALSFYNSLTSSQRQQAHGGLDASTLNDGQKRAYLEAVLWGALKGKGSPANLPQLLAGDFREQLVMVAEESFGSGVKNRQGKEMVGARKFFIYLGPRVAPVRFDAEVKGKEPKKDGDE